LIGDSLNSLGIDASLTDLLVILGKEQIANSFITTTALTVLGNTTTTLTDQIQYNFEAIVTEERIVVGSDHAFSLQVITDGKTKWTDPDVVQARYAIPLNYASLGQNFNAQNTIQHIVQNTGGTDVYFSVTLIGVTMPIDWWTHFVKVYMDSITKGLGFKPSPLHGVRAIGER